MAFSARVVGRGCVAGARSGLQKKNAQSVFMPSHSYMTRLLDLKIKLYALVKKKALRPRPPAHTKSGA